MFEPVQKCENNAISKQNYTLKLFIAVKMTYCCCSSLGGHLDFLYFHLKKFYNIDYWTIAFGKMFLTWAIPGPISFFWSVLNKHYKFYTKLMGTNFHPVYGAGIRTHNVLNIIPPLPLYHAFGKILYCKCD